MIEGMVKPPAHTMDHLEAARPESFCKKGNARRDLEPI